MVSVVGQSVAIAGAKGAAAYILSKKIPKRRLGIAVQEAGQQTSF